MKRSKHLICKCADCGNLAARCKIETELFAYAYDKAIYVDIPVWTCDDCGFAFTDEVADKIKDNAILEALS